MTCHLCPDPLDTSPIVGTSSRGGKPSRRLACSRCGLVQVSPQPSQETIDALYTSGDYHASHPPPGLSLQHADGSTTFVPPGTPEYDRAVDGMHEERADAVVKALALERGAKVLEVGCAEGRTLAALVRRGAWAIGLEPDAGKASTAEASGRCVVHGTIDDLADTNTEADGKRWHYDAVIAFHVLEHFPSPLDALTKIRSLLKPGGKVFFEVPNVSQPDLPLSDHWQWVHLYDFSPDTLRSLLHHAGFDDIQINDRRVLRAWATDNGSAPREYQDHHGPTGEDVARFLTALEAGEPAHLGPARPLSEIEKLDKSIPPYDAPALDALRAELRAAAKTLRAGHERMASAYDDAGKLIAGLAEHLTHEAMIRFEDYTHDEWAHYFGLGEGHAYHEIKYKLTQIKNTMDAVRLRGGEEGEA